MKRISRNAIFNSAELSQNLTQKSVRGGVITISSQACKLILSTASTVILARLLTPDDFGLIAMVIVVIAFADMFKDAGLSMATVQKDEINHDQISTLFWINVLLSCFLGLCILGASPLIAGFYKQPELKTVTAVLSISFFISGFMIQHQALLRRHLKFGALAIIQIASQIITLGVTVILALFGFRYWSLVGGAITNAFVGTSMTIFFCPWVPGRPKNVSGIRNMMNFGGYLVGHNFLNYLFRNLDKVIIGRISGDFVLGLYSKAYQLLLFPINQLSIPIAAVAIPVLSKLQNNHIAYKQFYLRAIYFIAFFSMPITIFLFAHSKEIIILILGDKWLPSAGFFKILCISAIYQPITNTTGWLFVSSGRTNKMFRWRLSTIWISVSLYFLGAYFNGALGVASAHTISVLMLTIPVLWYSQRGTNIGTFNIFKSTFRPLLSAVFAAILSELIFPNSHNLILSCLLMLTAYMIFNCIFAFSFSPLMDFHYIIKRYLFKVA
ncbi:MAG: lipopolysaccharide biosynthesis protein [Bacteroidales bacterium]|nr:lipopolysaccharide biosynthesis protein [Bacteroidales bacterium]